jgi:uncharacterized surface protein with fasciclin (FAS1) repeats
MRSKAVKHFVDGYRYLKTTRMKKSIFALAIALASVSFSFAQTIWVGGEEMYPSKNIIQNALNSKDHTTLVAAVKAAGLVETLQGSGPFTVFAPTNGAFSKLPQGTVETLLKPENKNMLTSLLTYHVVSGKYDSEAIAKAIKSGKGTAELKTVAGGKLWLMMNGSKNVIMKDEKGNYANISIYDVNQSNGVIHVIDAVVMPK